MKTLGARTKYGKVEAVGCIDGERYYWLIDKYGTVSMLPAAVVEGREYRLPLLRTLS